MRAFSLLILSSLAVAGCANTPREPTERERKVAAELAEAKPVGEPINCINLRSIRDSDVRSDQVIDFRMNGGQVYRSTLPNSCPQLGFERAFSYATSLSQLCSTDIITVIVQAGGPRRGASCGLGQFQQVEIPKKKD